MLDALGPPCLSSGVRPSRIAMNYWGDRRDQLETLYPTCMSFCHYHAKFVHSLVEQTKRGVIFLHAFWSGPSAAKFKYACYALEDSVPWDSFEFHVVDVDGLPASSIFEQHQQLGGYGEAFWIKDGSVFASQGREWSNEQFNENTSNLLRA
jgi:hypothetical protein